MGEKWGKMGKKWVKNEVTGVEKTALMHASAHLMPPLLCGAKRSSMSSSYSADDESTYAAASVMAAPKPTMVWNVVSGSTRMLGEDGAAPSGMSGSCAKRWLWSAVVR